jgi:hypothetical protein
MQFCACLADFDKTTRSKFLKRKASSSHIKILSASLKTIFS